MTTSKTRALFEKTEKTTSRLAVEFIHHEDQLDAVLRDATENLSRIPMDNVDLRRRGVALVERAMELKRQLDHAIEFLGDAKNTLADLKCRM